MQKPSAVEEAAKLMSVAREWSVWRWLLEKPRVRAASDRATDALAALDKKVKAAWGDDLKKAYHECEALAELERNPRAKRAAEKAKDEARHVSADVKAAARKAYEADATAEQARLDAEDTFAEAERRLSAGTAREGAGKALETWDLKLKAIRKSEAIARQG